MKNALGLLKQRRFLPLFATQFLGAFNDNLFKQAMVIFVTYRIYDDARLEQNFTALATALSLIPFFLLSAVAGQLADSHDKARMIRIIKTAEIAIMTVGAGGLLLGWQGKLGDNPVLIHAGTALMLAGVLLLGVHSAFFGPIKYAILPQHLEADEVLGGTGLVEAATYIAILAGTVLAGIMAVQHAAITVLLVALIGWMAGLKVPPAPREGARLAINYNPFTASWRLVSATLHVRRLFLAICAISFFWMMGAILIIVFAPLAKNVLTADKQVATFLTALFSVGVAIGSVVINSLLKGRTSARHSPAAVLAMGACMVAFALLCHGWPEAPHGHYYDWLEFIELPRGSLIILSLIGIAVFGGMFVVPLYAFLTTTVARDQTARTVAANNVVNSGAMVIGAVLVQGLAALHVSPSDTLFAIAAMCPVAAFIGWRLHCACD